MRVIAGRAKGRRLVGPKRGAPIRPVLDQVKEAIFNILYDVTDFEILDCFAGTGALGIEALSRGAAHATFIDAAPQAIALIMDNLDRCHYTEYATIVRAPAARGLQQLARQEQTFDVIFIDPPYEKHLVSPTLQLTADLGLLRPRGRIIIEHHPKEPPQPPAAFRVVDERKYGQTRISFIGRPL
ncbi:MAG: 16S rRNA (guanine(966)-N(2))-methyltransferase RsmD [Deltaproteobacteria bacterium]|nr:16S rRNA (guanine(966)-N(2))-methyltransferase RsmD [Deltaproteobacteria bacterium]